MLPPGTSGKSSPKAQLHHLVTARAPLASTSTWELWARTAQTHQGEGGHSQLRLASIVPGLTCCFTPQRPCPRKARCPGAADNKDIQSEDNVFGFIKLRSKKRKRKAGWPEWSQCRGASRLLGRVCTGVAGQPGSSGPGGRLYHLLSKLGDRCEQSQGSHGQRPGRPRFRVVMVTLALALPGGRGVRARA